MREPDSDRTSSSADVLEPDVALTGQLLPAIDDDRLAASGLDDIEVANRMGAGLNNRLQQDSNRSLGRILRANLLTAFNAVVGGGVVLLLLLGQWQDAIFGLAALTNVVIGVVQEYRAKRLLDRLALLNAPSARVLRGGIVVEIAVENVVIDDLLVLRAGDQVSADAVLLSAVGIEIDESLLTGESEPVPKTLGDDALSGSAVIAGHGKARVVRVGAESFASRLTAEAKRFSLVNSELRNAANRIVRWITWALVPLIVLVLNAQMQAGGGWDRAINSGSWRHALVGTVASAASVIPQGLILMTSLAFALAAVKLARQKVLVQELAAVEGLARVDIVCFDKTGTLTEGGIVFDAVHETGAATAPGWREILGWFGADANANATARCLRSEFPSKDVLEPLSFVPFSSARKWSAISLADGETRGLWVLGAPEVVLSNSEGPVSAAVQRASELAASGLRTLVLAHTEQPMSTQDAASARLGDTLRPVVIVTFREKIRPDAGQTLDYFREQGVGIRVISGDNPQTVAAVAREVGLIFEGDGYDARNLPADLAQMGEVLERQLVFGRVTPMQKKDMVQAMQQRGHVVAMTGDGVNDALALKRADIGIAMGSGAAATKAVSRLVLLDGQFSRLPGVVAEGRRVIANVELVSKLFLAKTVYAVLLSLAVGVLLWKFPFLPRQLSPTDGLTIGIPAFFLALAPNLKRYEPGFLRRSLRFSIPSGVVISAAIVAVVAYAELSGGYSQRTVQTAAIITLSLVGLWVLVVVARPLNRWRALLIVMMYLGMFAFLTTPILQNYMNFRLPLGDLLVVSIGVATIGSLGIEVIHRFLTSARLGNPQAPIQRIRRPHL